MSMFDESPCIVYIYGKYSDTCMHICVCVRYLYVVHETSMRLKNKIIMLLQFERRGYHLRLFAYYVTKLYTFAYIATFLYDSYILHTELYGLS
jgi:hypothetical protein